MMALVLFVLPMAQVANAFRHEAVGKTRAISVGKNVALPSVAIKALISEAIWGENSSCVIAW